MKPIRLLALLLCSLAPLLHAQSGLTRLGEFRVNEFTTGNQNSANIAADAEGNFVIVWQGVGEGDADGGVFLRRYNADGSPRGPQDRVNTTTAGAQISPRVAMNATGQFVVAWWGSGGPGLTNRIFAQRFGSDGQAVGVNFRADTGADNLDHIYPSVGIDAAGKFVVGYESRSASEADIYVQFYGANGTQIGNQVPIVAAGGDTEGRPSIAMAPSGDFVASYVSYERDLTLPVILARRYSVQTGNFGSVINVAALPSTLDALNTLYCVAIRDDASFAVTWDKDARDGSGSGVYARRYRADGSPAGGDFRVNTTTSGDQLSPSVTFDSRDRFTIVWQSPGSTPGSGTDIFGQRYHSDGSVDGGQFQVNTFTTGNQTTFYQPSVIPDAAGNFVVVWQSDLQDGDAGGIYADKFFLPPSTQDEFRVNTTTTGEQREPSVASDATGNFAVVWRDESSGTPAIRRQHFTANGRHLGVERIVATSALGPVLAMNASGASVVVWENQAGGPTPDIIAQRYDAGGAPMGGMIQVTGETGTQTAQVAPSVAVYPDGRFVVVWAGRPSSDGSDNIHGQLFGADGVPLPPQFRIDQAPDDASNQDDADVAVLPDGGFVVVWGDSVGLGPYQPKARIYDVSGANVTARTNQFAITSASPASVRHPTSVAVDGSGRIVFIWESESEGNGGEVFARRCSADGQTLGPAFQVNSTGVGSQKRASVAAASNGDFIALWCSDQVAVNGFDVFLKRFRPGAVLSDPVAVLENERVVNIFNSGEQGFLSASASALRGRKKVAVDAFGNYVAVWHSQGQDGSGYGIYATQVRITNPPLATTGAATNLTASTATLHGTVTPNDVAVDVSFEHAESEAALGTGSARTLPATPASLAAGITTAQAVSANVTGLLLGVGNAPRTHYFRTRATPSGGATIVGPTVAFTVQNTPPVAVDDFFIIGDEGELDVLANDTDADPNDTRLIQTGSIAGATLAAAGFPRTTIPPTKIFYDGSSFFGGARDGDTFTYVVEDSRGGTDTGEVRVFSERVLAGNYVGLIGAPGSSASQSGRIDIKISPSGLITGSFTWQSQPYPFKGAELAPNGTFTKPVPKKGLPEGVNATLQLTLQLNPITRVLTGKLLDTQTNTEVDVEVDGTVSADDVADLPDAGTYTAFIDPGTGSMAAVEGPSAGGAVLPRGTGFTLITVGKAKTRPGRFVGRMPDAQAFSSGVRGFVRALRGAAGDPRYRVRDETLYRTRVGRTFENRGFVGGNVGFDRGRNEFGADLNWERGANVGTRFPGGFETGEAGLRAALLAIKYPRLSAGTPPAGIVVDNRDFNARLELYDGGIGTDRLRNLKVTRKGGVFRGVIVPGVGENVTTPPVNLKLTLNARGAKFSGSFIHPADVPLDGIITRRTPVTKFDGVFKGSGSGSSGEGTFAGPTDTGRIVILAQ